MFFNNSDTNKLQSSQPRLWDLLSPNLACSFSGQEHGRPLKCGVLRKTIGDRWSLFQSGPSCSLASYYLLGGHRKAERVYKHQIGSWLTSVKMQCLLRMSVEMNFPHSSFQPFTHLQENAFQTSLVCPTDSESQLNNVYYWLFSYCCDKRLW